MCYHNRCSHPAASFPGVGSCYEQHRGIQISDRKFRINQMITAKQVRLIGENGEQMGIVPTVEAMGIAHQQELDLVEVSPAAEPPVCRLMDYGKFLYERTKKERQSRKSQRSAEVKEIRLHPKTGEHDRMFKTRQLRKFLESGAKVKVRVRFRGREVTHREMAHDMLMAIATDTGDIATVEQQPQMEGRSMLMVLVPSKK